MKNDRPSRGKAKWMGSQQALNSCRPMECFYSCLGGSSVCFLVALIFCKSIPLDLVVASDVGPVFVWRSVGLAHFKELGLISHDLKIRFNGSYK